jgi:non-ribosomal peptide synthetase component F
LFINTLPVRIRVGEEGVEGSVRRMHGMLADLLRHEHASLALAQRCSGVPAPRPLFTALLNYRHSREVREETEVKEAWEGMEWLRGEERTNYPFILSVDDFGEGFLLTAQTVASVGPKRVCEFMSRAVEELVSALEREPWRGLCTLDVLPGEEREQVLEKWNETEEEYEREKCVHELFEEQVEKTPGATAVVF